MWEMNFMTWVWDLGFTPLLGSIPARIIVRSVSLDSKSKTLMIEQRLH